MASSPDTVEITPPADPAELQRRRGLGVGFWAVLILCFMSVIAGAAVASYAPRLIPAKAPAAPVEAPAASPSAPPAPALTGLGAAPADLESRLAAVAGAQDGVLRAAAEALAVATLSQAAESSSPFADELIRLERMLPPGQDLSTLRAIAAEGAPSRAALAADFDAAAAKAIVAARTPGEGSGLVARAVHAISSVMVVRRIDSVAGTGPDAVLARAGRMAAAGDIEGAIRTTAALPAEGQAALAPWRAAAQRRIDLDRRLAALRNEAMADIARAQQGLI